MIVTNQDHEANTGAIRRAAERVGCTIREWRTDADTGLLDIDEFAALLSTIARCSSRFRTPRTSSARRTTSPASPTLAHAVGARVIVDGVSFAPHSLPDVAALDADVYLFSLYKTYSVHQGLMVVRNGLLDELPNQSHFFNDGVADKRLNPAGPDHAQVARRRRGARLRRRCCIATTGARPTIGLRAAASAVSALWRAARGFAHAAAARRARRSGRRAADRPGDGRARRISTGARPSRSRRCAASRATSPTNSCSAASRPARATTTRPVCSTGWVSIPTAGWCGCRSSTTRRPPTSTGPSTRWHEVLG